MNLIKFYPKGIIHRELSCVIHALVGLQVWFWKQTKSNALHLKIERMYNLFNNSM